MNGLIARKTATRSVTILMARSISSCVVKRLVNADYPIPKRMEVCASSGPSPMDRSTYEGSRDALVQAEPELTAMFLIAMIRLSPSTNSNEKFMMPGYRASLSPLSRTCGIRSIDSCSWSLSLWTCAWSESISSSATRLAAPNPTQSWVRAGYKRCECTRTHSSLLATTLDDRWMSRVYARA